MNPLWFFWFVMILLMMIGGSQAQTDQTLESEATGKDVAEAAYDKVKKLFGVDHRFLIRIAWVESQFGKSSKTFRENYYGGIWQVDKNGFMDTQNVDSHPNLKLKHKQIKNEYGIDWMTITWEDLTKPFYSALGAQLLLFNKNKPIPNSVETGDFYYDLSLLKVLDDLNDHIKSVTKLCHNSRTYTHRGLKI